MILNRLDGAISTMMVILILLPEVAEKKRLSMKIPVVLLPRFGSRATALTFGRLTPPIMTMMETLTLQLA